MRRFSFLFIFIALMLVLPAIELHGQVFTAGLDLLQISKDARSVSMGDAGTALDNGASAIHQNPANLLFNSSEELQASYHSWVLGSSYQHIGAVLKPTKGVIGLSVYGNSISDIEIRNRPGQAIGTFSVDYLVLSAAYAREFLGINLGISGSFLNEQYLENNARGYAFGFGASKDLFSDERLIVGLAANHIGEMQRLNILRTQLPTNIRAGIKSRVLKLDLTSDQGSSFPIRVDMLVDWVYEPDQSEALSQNAIQNENGYFNAGMEVTIGKIIRLRSGYKGWDGARKWAYGIGIRSNDVDVDIAQIPFQEGLGNALSATLKYRF